MSHYLTFALFRSLTLEMRLRRRRRRLLCWILSIHPSEHTHIICISIYLFPPFVCTAQLMDARVLVSSSFCFASVPCVRDARDAAGLCRNGRSFVWFLGARPLSVEFSGFGQANLPSFAASPATRLLAVNPFTREGAGRSDEKGHASSGHTHTYTELN